MIFLSCLLTCLVCFVFVDTALGVACFFVVLCTVICLFKSCLVVASNQRNVFFTDFSLWWSHVDYSMIVETSRVKLMVFFDHLCIFSVFRLIWPIMYGTLGCFGSIALVVLSNVILVQH